MIDKQIPRKAFQRKHLRADLTRIAQTEYNRSTPDIDEFVTDFCNRYPNYLLMFEREYIERMAEIRKNNNWR